MIVKSIQDIRFAIKVAIETRDSNFSTHVTSCSAIWREWVNLLSFIFDFSDESLMRIRLHTGFGFFLGSNWSRVYFEKHEIEKKILPMALSPTILDYDRLIKNVPDEFKCTEIDINKKLISISYKGRFINEDILRVQTTVSNLYHSKLLDKVEGNILEIGAGYGLLANQLHRISAGSKIIIIDHPEILFWSCVYTFINNPKSKICLLVEDVLDTKEVDEADFVFVPPYRIDLIKNMHFSLLINENSFCEMTSEQVEFYLESFKETRFLYSNNRNRQFMNEELKNINLNELLGKYCNLFPSPTMYDRLYDGKESQHNHKYIFWGTRDLKDSMEFDVDLIQGTMIRKSF